MSEQPNSHNGAQPQSPFGMPNFGAAWQTPLKTFVPEQAEWFEESRKMMGAWMKRRQDAMESGLKTLGAIAECRDPGQVAALYNDWYKGSLERLMADMNDARDEGAKLAEISQRSMIALFRRGLDGAAEVRPGNGPQT